MKAYLAGPDVFRSDAKEHLSKLSAICKAEGIQALTPLDTEVPEGLKGGMAAGFIFESNLKLIQEADIVIANISPFRGPSVDPGTAFEIGYAHALGKGVFAYSDDTQPYAEKCEVGNAGYYARRGLYPVVENFGLTDNLMIVVPVMAVCHTFETALKMAAGLRKKAA